MVLAATQMTAEADPLELRNLLELTKAQMAALSALKVSDHQEFLGGSFLESLTAWNEGPSSHVLGHCFMSGSEPVGLTLFKRPPLSPDWVPSYAVSLHGLKIATPWQGQGLGQKACRLAIDQLQRDWPASTVLMLAADAENAAALTVYRSMGMTDSGPIFDGNHGLEHRLHLSLPP